MKILIVQHIGFLNSQGGTEKMASFFANQFSRRGHEVVLATNDPKDGFPIYPLLPSVRFENIFVAEENIITLRIPYNYKGKNPIQWIKSKIKKKIDKANNQILKKRHHLNSNDEVFLHNLKERAQVWNPFFEKEQPDVILTMSLASVLEITYAGRPNFPIVNTVHGRPDYDYTDVLWFRSVVEMELLQQSFQHVSGIQIFFESYKDFIPTAFQGISEVIPNPVVQIPDTEIADLLKPKSRYQILHIGSLVDAGKQQHVAMEAFARLAKKYPEWDLIFWGEGPDQAYLIEKAAQLGLKGRIQFAGYTNNPISKLKQADIFVFPSKYEGFGLALAEAMSVGLPVVGFSTCSGVNELIRHNFSGFLADDLAEFTSRMDQLMGDVFLRQKIGAAGHQQMKEFQDLRVVDQWMSFLNKVIHVEANYAGKG